MVASHTRPSSTTPTSAPVAPGTPTTASDVVRNNAFAKSTDPIRNEIHNARAATLESFEHLKNLEAQKATLPAATPISKELAQDLKNAQRNLNSDITRVGRSRGKFGSSVKDLFRTWGETIGIKPEKLVSSKLGGTSDQAFIKATKMEAGVFEQMLSKPIKIASRFPKTSLAVTALLATIGIGSAIRSHRENQVNNQQEVLADMLSQQAQLGNQRAAAAAQAPTYQITPEEYAMMQARMRGGADAPRTGHADNIAAARAQEAQAAEAGTPIAAL